MLVQFQQSSSKLLTANFLLLKKRQFETPGVAQLEEQSTVESDADIDGSAVRIRFLGFYYIGGYNKILLAPIV